MVSVANLDGNKTIRPIVPLVVCACVCVCVRTCVCGCVRVYSPFIGNWHTKFLVSPAHSCRYPENNSTSCVV